MQFTALHEGFLQAATSFPERPAVAIGAQAITYGEIRERAASIAATLRTEPGGAFTAVFAQRTFTAFSAVLGALLRGHGFVPLNSSFPVSRTRQMLERSGARTVVVDRPSAQQLPEVLEGLPEGMTIILPDHDDPGELAATLAQHKVFGARDLRPASDWRPEPVEPDSLAYLLFTSGSTGMPKGVGITHANVRSFVDFAVDRYGIGESDRLSQTFSTTFDLSIFDMFVAWERGACICCPTRKELMKPDKFIIDTGLTLWFSVPSIAVLMKQMRLLKPGRFPGLRMSLFCGEALPAEVAQAWQAAAPNSEVENIYGPTELTIACTFYRWNPVNSPSESLHGIVPIGEPFPHMKALVVDPQLREVPVGQEGELIMTGPQMAPGYWMDPGRTAEAFVRPPGNDETFYRTGDRVMRQAPGQPLCYLGRLDSQVKVRGYRVELGEIEAVLREEARVEAAVALAWPVTPAGAGGIVAFLCAKDVDVQSVKKRVERRLPSYMVPTEMRCIEQFPLNSNGKIDRGVLRRQLEGGT